MKKFILLALIFAPMTVFAQAQKFGYVDAQAILASMPEAIKADSDIKAEYQIMQNELQELAKEFDKEANAYMQKRETLSKTQQEEKEKALMEMRSRVEQADQQNAQKLQKLQEEKMGPIQEKLLKAIDNVGKNGKYVFIVPKGAFLYMNESLMTDVAAEVKAELNKLK